MKSLWKQMKSVFFFKLLRYVSYELFHPLLTKSNYNIPLKWIFSRLILFIQSPVINLYISVSSDI